MVEGGKRVWERRKAMQEVVHRDEERGVVGGEIQGKLNQTPTLTPVKKRGTQMTGGGATDCCCDRGRKNEEAQKVKRKKREQSGRERRTGVKHTS